MPELFHIVYVSFSCSQLSEKELKDLLTEIRRKNKSHDVTGMLLYNDGSFIQVVEGEKQILKDLYERIKKDSRHENIVKLVEEPIEKRTFPDWSMGYEVVDYKQVSKIPGYSNFMSSDNPEELIKGSTKEIMSLLNSFKKYT